MAPELSAGWTKRMREVIASCPTCHGFGRIRTGITDTGEPGFGKLVACPSCADAQNQLRTARDMRRLAERVGPYSAMTDVLRRRTFDEFDLESDTDAIPAFNAVLRWAEAEMPWTYVWGPPGNGKTHLAAAAVNQLEDDSEVVLFLTAPELLAMIRTGFDEGDSERLVRHCLDVPWLVIDDFGAERVTPWAHETWFRILNSRYNARTSTLLASNVAPQKVGDPRLASRFEDTEVCLIVPNPARDYRTRRNRHREGQNA